MNVLRLISQLIGIETLRLTENNQGCTLHCDNKRKFADRLVVLPIVTFEVGLYGQ